jgi:hypothetical protein
VVRDDGDAALPMLERARDLAVAAGDKLTLSYAVRHLGFADMAAGRLDAARELLEESVRLRRELGFMSGVAAGVLTLAWWIFSRRVPGGLWWIWGIGVRRGRSRRISAAPGRRIPRQA